MAGGATQSHLLRRTVRRSPLLEFLLLHFGNLIRRSHASDAPVPSRSVLAAVHDNCPEGLLLEWMFGRRQAGADGGAALSRRGSVILSMYSSSAFVAQALQNGAIGYVLKGCPDI